MQDWIWAAWFLAIIVSFAVFEARAFKFPERQNTLSRVVWNIGQKWPLSLVLFGMVFGGLAVHFYWNWCPAIMAPGQGG